MLDPVLSVFAFDRCLERCVDLRRVHKWLACESTPKSKTLLGDFFCEIRRLKPPSGKIWRAQRVLETYYYEA